ncbi:MAG: linear amide C-N hydrolase [Cyanobacteria bacterium J06638_28]
MGGLKLWMVALVVAVIGSNPVDASTDVRLIAEDESALTARTMDAQSGVNSRVIIQPRKAQFISPAPNDKAGLAWMGKYGFVYLDGFDLAVPMDGLNEVGLGMGALLLPGYTEYVAIGPNDSPIALSNLQFGAWILSQFATVEEVRLALSTVKVWGEPVPVFNDAFMPLRYVIHDANGSSLIVEFVEGNPRVYENEVGVLTNAPSYDWHLTNLQNYQQLSPVSTVSSETGTTSVGMTGQGSGWTGLPGDPTSTSRFVATAMTLAALPAPTDAVDALVMAQTLINRLEIPRGLVQYMTSNGVIEGDYTQWSVFRDHTNKVLYWRTEQDMTLRSLDLTTVDFDLATSRRVLPIATEAPTILPVDISTFTVEADSVTE